MKKGGASISNILSRKDRYSNKLQKSNAHNTRSVSHLDKIRAQNQSQGSGYGLNNSYASVRASGNSLSRGQHGLLLPLNQSAQHPINQSVIIPESKGQFQSMDEIDRREAQQKVAEALKQQE